MTNETEAAIAPAWTTREIMAKGSKRNDWTAVSIERNRAAGLLKGQQNERADFWHVYTESTRNKSGNRENVRKYHAEIFILLYRIPGVAASLYSRLEIESS